MLRKYFFKHENISGQKFVSNNKNFERNVPGIKQIKIRPQKHYNWKFWLLLGILLTLIVARFINYKIFDSITGLSFSLKINDSVGDKKTVSFFIFMLLHVIFTSVIALFTVIYAEYRQIISAENGLKFFYQVFAFIAMVYIIKIVTIKSISSIVGLSNVANQTILNTFAVNNLIGMLLLPVLLIYTYSPSVQIKFIAFIANIIIITAGIFFRIIKNAVISLKLNTYSSIYIIIYICAFEIIPWLIIFKLLINKLLA